MNQLGDFVRFIEAGILKLSTIPVSGQIENGKSINVGNFIHDELFFIENTGSNDDN